MLSKESSTKVNNELDQAVARLKGQIDWLRKGTLLEGRPMMAVTDMEVLLDFVERNKEPKPWFSWNGDYEKQSYDVWVSGCDVVLGCWPNAGVLCAMDGTGREWRPDQCLAVRVSDFQGRYPSPKDDT